MENPENGENLNSFENGEVGKINKVEDICPLKNFVFVKTHKTGSSTMSNILLRHAENNKLNQLMGRYPTGTEYGDLSRHSYPPPPPEQHYNAFLMHADYNHQFLMSKLPPSTIFFTFTRDPVSRYISAFHFFKLDRYYDGSDFDNAVNLHMADNARYLISTDQCRHCGRTVNSVAHDLGFDFKGYVNTVDKDKFLGDFLAKLRREMDLVLISEYYDLSLVLFARRYCLTFDDISYLKSLESTTRPYVSQSTREKLRQFQYVDAVIYDFYNATFWELVNKEEGLLEEAEKFKEHNKMVHSKCVAGKQIGTYDTYQFILTEFGRTDFQCRAMCSRVLPFAHLIEKRNQGLRNDGPHQKDYLTLQDLYNIRYGQ